MQLTLDNVGHRYAGGNWLFSGLQHSFGAGQVTALVGPSGTGKSTLLQILSGGLSPTAGRVVRVGSLATVHQVAYGTQRRTLGDHLALPMLARGLPRSEADPAVESLAVRFGLEALVEAPYRRLSGGEAQRLMLAVAVAQGPDIILADEPTASLDTANATSVIGVLKQLSADGAIVVVATHDARAQQACDAVLDLVRSTQEREHTP